MPVANLRNDGRGVQGLGCSSEVWAGKRNVAVSVIPYVEANQEKEVSALRQGIFRITFISYVSIAHTLYFICIFRREEGYELNSGSFPY